jgi:hypothetical protein
MYTVGMHEITIKFLHLKIAEERGRARQVTDDNIARRMPVACWITKATDTRSEYVIFIAFPRKQWLRERSSVLPITYVASLVLYVRWMTNYTV